MDKTLALGDCVQCCVVRMVLYTPRVKSPQAQPRDDKVCVECNFLDIWKKNDMGGIAAVAEITANVPQGGNQICHASRQDTFSAYPLLSN